ncbi:hypothetical protein BJY04DRAFT_194245 [Aspergillus karnatakaensis]|uniref:uncharacterized protein n=1 Tax=Aspergillus karnatakaensis TaxID=1810916 RepID=UPI003CCD4FE9
MPTPLPSSFASAAAGNTQDPSGRRGDGNTSGEWSRTRMNGATQTFRRPSVATNPSHIREPLSATTPTGGAYPTHMSSTLSNVARNGAPGDTRYSKEQLLDLYKAQRDTGILTKNVSDYFVADWNPHNEPASANGVWGKRDDHKDNSTGPEVCWDHGGHVEPLGLVDMTDDEKETFSVSVNSPLKPPPTNAAKENTTTTGPGRRASISQTQGSANAYNTSSPSSARPGPRRRETGESVGNPMSPTTGGSRFFRDEPNTATPPPSLLRRKTDFRDTTSVSKWEEKEKEAQGQSREAAEAPSPFGSLKRSSTNPVALAGSTSPWPSTSQNNAGFSPMGAFGAFSLGTGTSSAAQTPTTEKRPGFGSVRGESRLKGLFSKDSSEDISSIREKPSLSNLERLGESEAEKRSNSPWGDQFKTRTGRSETNPFSEEPRSGSAALGGSQDVSTPSQAADLGFSAFGMTSSIPGFRELMQSHENSRNPTPHLHGREPTSPTNTNPYQSPHGDRGDVDDVDTDGSDIQNTNHPGISGLRDSTAFGAIRRVGSGMDLPSIDRSQTSSVVGNRSFSNLGSLGGLPSLSGGGGWPTSAAVGTPTKDRSAFVGGFGDPIFGSVADLQSPALSTLGGGGLFSPHTGISGTGSIGRSSKLGSLFPQAMQEQIQSDQTRQDLSTLDETQQDLQGDVSGQPAPAATSTSHTPVSAVGSIPTSMLPEGQQVSQAGSATGSVPTAQQRTMVMPDRMRWIYRDPQGNIQGPWTGLEMHDWFKAGFFSPDLQIRKLEDPEFEPLAQLVRRIGNSREPFLVPQIGVPHGPEPNAPTWGSAGPTPTGSAQPPFPGSFPSFGTTLTAEQQNALERRKQEEQYLMARQKEHLAQQQALMKQIQFQPGTAVPHGIHPPQLQHHSSAHSLHSQPSFGSIASPIGFQPSPIQGSTQQQQQQSASSFFDAPGPIRANPLPNVGPQMIGTDFLNSSQEQLPTLLDRLNVSSRPDPFAFGSPTSFAARQPDSLFPNPQVATMLQDRARLQQEQEQFDSTQGDSLFDQQAREERLRQFHALRAQEGEFGLRTAEGLPTHPATALSHPGDDLESSSTLEEVATALAGEETMLTLSQQVQKAAQEQEQQEQAQIVTENVWGTVADSAMPQPFPPPPSASPLPAPAAQRNRQNVAESLAANSRSQTQTPVEAPTTSIAPWAKEVNELPKGPSLKEIQEAEARTAAQKEELAAAARRAQLLAEQERLSQAQAQQAPGLPSSANWASSGSPATPTSTAASVWNSKGTAPTSTAKKTLAQIQKEEEALARKQRAAAAAAAAAQSTIATGPAPPSTGKRYADLASKAPAASPITASSGAWTTVGASGKAKAPPVAPTGPRSTSGPIPIAASPVRPKAVTAVTAVPRTLPVSTPSANPSRAMEEFNKWAKVTLGKGLNSNINVDDFVQQLQLLPAEAEIISDSVYANSQTLDGRRFAEEFIRRRKLADKGIVESVSTSALAEKNGGGWSEVAKKGSSNASTPREEDTSSAAFKMVAPRKKGKR